MATKGGGAPGVFLFYVLPITTTAAEKRDHPTVVVDARDASKQKGVLVTVKESIGTFFNLSNYNEMPKKEVTQKIAKKGDDGQISLQTIKVEKALPLTRQTNKPFVIVFSTKKPFKGINAKGQTVTKQLKSVTINVPSIVSVAEFADWLKKEVLGKISGIIGFKTPHGKFHPLKSTK